MSDNKLKILFSATCHAVIISQLLKLSDCFNQNFEIEPPLLNWLTPNEVLFEKLQNANVFLYQNYHDISPEQFLEHMPAQGIVIKIPYVTSKIYWPSHNLHACLFYAKDQKNHIPFCDAFLDQLIEEHQDIEKITSIYANANLAEIYDIAQNFEDQINYLKWAQQGTSFDLADFVKENFAQKRLFHTINHPNAPIFENIVNTLLPLLGCNDAITFPDDILDGEQTIIHPSIIEYYNLEWCNKNTIWNITASKKGTFEEYLDLYIKSKLIS